jgi:UDP-glucuronate 4-epimerase
MKVLVTGAAGFIGMHVAQLLLKRGDEVVGVDNINNYYDPALKLERIAQNNNFPNFKFEKLDIIEQEKLNDLFSKEKFDSVVHLAAQAGVRYSIQNPNAYLQTNLVGFGYILEACRLNKILHLVYASSSSVYGGNTRMPFNVNDNVDHPVSLYAASKKANELMAHSYSHLYGLPTTGLRYFTVYGPWGRPDMAPWLFSNAILDGRPIELFNHGLMERDFTYVDDIADGTIRVLDRIPIPNAEFLSDYPEPGSSFAPYRIYNIGGQKPVKLLTFIKILEEALGQIAHKNLMPMQLGDVVSTYADVSDLEKDFDFSPKTSLEQGVERWVNWYRNYRNEN